MLDTNIKPWIIEVKHGFGCSNYYGAWSVEDPIANDLVEAEFYAQASEDLWQDYGWTETGFDDERLEGETEEEREEEREQIREDFITSVEFDCYPDEYDEINSLEIVYNEIPETFDNLSGDSGIGEEHICEEVGS